MNRLGENCRELLRYILYDKLSLKEVAERMDMGSEGAAKTRHHRCKRKLAEMIMENQNLISLLKE